jgi:hypothetical protein
MAFEDWSVIVMLLFLNSLVCLNNFTIIKFNPSLSMHIERLYCTTNQRPNGICVLDMTSPKGLL